MLLGNNSSWAAVAMANGSDENSWWPIYSDTVRRYVGIWMLVAVCLLGTPANLCVLVCCRRLLAASQGQRSLYQYLVFSMTAADVLFTGVYAPAMFAFYFLHVRPTRGQCALILIASHCSSVASSLSLFFLNVDKFFAVVKPLLHAQFLTRRRVLLLVLACWTLSGSWSVYFVVDAWLLKPALPHCGMTLASFQFYFAFAMAFFIAPTVAAAAMSVSVALVVCSYPAAGAVIGFRFAADGRVQKCFKTSRCPSEASTCSDPTKTGRWNYERLGLRLRTLTFVFATTAWSLLTCLPYRIVYLIYLSRPQHHRMAYLPAAFGLFALMAINAAGNPFITLLTQRRYRLMIAASVQRLRKMFHDRKPPLTNDKIRPKCLRDFPPSTRNRPGGSSDLPLVPSTELVSKL